MTNKIILLITLLSYSVIASQPFMYILALKHAQLNLDGNSYTALRKLINASMNNNFKYILYTTVFATLALIIVNIKDPGGVVFITATIAFVALVVDIFLTLKGNLPINAAIDTWSPGNLPANWTDYRTSWFRIFHYRQVATIIGFASLLIGSVFGAK